MIDPEAIEPMPPLHLQDAAYDAVKPATPGHTQPSALQIEIIKGVRELEEKFSEFCDDMAKHPTDPRELSLARTEAEYAFMRLTRAVMKGFK